MGFAKSLLKIIGGSASVSTLDPLSVVSGLCSVASGFMEMKDVIEDFISQVIEITGSCLSYVHNYFNNGEDPYNIMPILKDIRKMLQDRGYGWIFSTFENALQMYAISKGDIGSLNYSLK